MTPEERARRVFHELDSMPGGFDPQDVVVAYAAAIREALEDQRLDLLTWLRETTDVPPNRWDDRDIEGLAADYGEARGEKP